jgi:hypothetical protein
MTYSLPVSHHTPKKLRKLQSPATRATLMKLGFNRNTDHWVVYGPSRYGGIGFRDPFVKQGIGQVELFVRHLRAGTTQGTLMCITLSWWQLVVGVSCSLLGAPTTLIPHDDSHWLSSIRHFLGSLDASLHVNGLELPQPLRDVDVCIMDAIHTLPGLKKAQLQASNRCRIYLGVIYVSEISTGVTYHARPGMGARAGCPRYCGLISLNRDQNPSAHGAACSLRPSS